MQSPKLAFSHNCVLTVVPKLAYMFTCCLQLCEHISPSASPDSQRPYFLCQCAIAVTLRSSENLATREKTGYQILRLSQLQYCLCSCLAYHIPLQLIKLKKQIQIFKLSSHWSTFMDRVLIPIQFPGERVHNTSNVSAVSLQYKFCIKQKCCSP